MRHVLTCLLLATLVACSDTPETGPDAAPDPLAERCADYCAWEHDITGVSVEGCTAECVAEDCADCCATTPTWPGCYEVSPEVCCPELCEEYAPGLYPAQCIKTCETRCALDYESCCEPPG